MEHIDTADACLCECSNLAIVQKYAEHISIEGSDFDAQMKVLVIGVKILIALFSNCFLLTISSVVPKYWQYF